MLTTALSLLALTSTVLASPLENAVPAAHPKHIAPTNVGKSFALIALAYHGDFSLSGSFFEPIHAGAGINALVANYTARDPSYYYNTTSGDIQGRITGNIPISLTLGEGGSGIPGQAYSAYFKHYSQVTMQFGLPQMGFSFNKTSNVLDPMSYEGKVLAICPWEFPPEIVYGLMWRNVTSPNHKGCADVYLKAI